MKRYFALFDNAVFCAYFFPPSSNLPLLPPFSFVFLYMHTYIIFPSQTHPSLFLFRSPPPRSLADDGMHEDVLPELHLRTRRCLPHLGAWDVTKQHHATVWMGDLNYRVEGIRRAVDRLISLQMYEVMQNNDQLSRERAAGRAFRNFEEAAISFPPTFKFDVGTGQYDSSAKQRVPSWTDRVLWKVQKDFRTAHRRNPKGFVRCVQYASLQDVSTSDHKAVEALLEVDVGGFVGAGGGKGGAGGRGGGGTTTARSSLT